MTVSPMLAPVPVTLAQRRPPSTYTYFATDWRTGQIRTELPLRGVTFNGPVSKHGTLTGTYRCGRNGWRMRNAAHPLLAGILVCRDGRPFRDYYLWSDKITGSGRDVEVQAVEWGSFFERVLVSPQFLDDVNGGDPLGWSQVDDHVIQRELIALAQERPSQDIGVQLMDTLGGVVSTLNVDGWDMADVAGLFTELGNRSGGPEWAFGVEGDIDAPRRVLQQGTPLGRPLAESGLMLEFVEQSSDPEQVEGNPVVTSLDNLFPGAQPNAAVHSLQGSGGNVIAWPGLERDGSNSAVRAWAIGGGEEQDMLLASATADELLPTLPLLEVARSYKSDTDTGKVTLQKHADADLAAARGLTVNIPLATFDDSPEVSSVRRGDEVRVELDSDMFNPRPYRTDARVLDMAIAPSDDGGYAQVTYTVTSTLEV